jgi:hypothetical protein
MRRRTSAEYLRKGRLLKRVFNNDGSYETIPRNFRYQSVQGTQQLSEQLLTGFMHTDTNAVIKAITDLKYDKGDKVILDDGETYEITQVQTESFNEFGRLRGIRRSAFVITLS